MRRRTPKSWTKTALLKLGLAELLTVIDGSPLDDTAAG
jgi:hypothetical protein